MARQFTLLPRRNYLVATVPERNTAFRFYDEFNGMEAILPTASS